MIFVRQNVPGAPAQDSDDRNDAAGPSRAHTAVGEREQPDASSPSEAAMVKLAQLLGRQAAREWFRSQGK